MMQSALTLGSILCNGGFCNVKADTGTDGARDGSGSTWATFDSRGECTGWRGFEELTSGDFTAGGGAESCTLSFWNRDGAPAVCDGGCASLGNDRS